jgi:hypothetical protein
LHDLQYLPFLIPHADSHPDNVYRKHGVAMKKRTTELLKRIPDDKNFGDESDSDGEDFFMEENSDSPRRDSVTPSLVDSEKPAAIVLPECDVAEKKEEEPDVVDYSLLEPVYYRKWRDLTMKLRLKIQKTRLANYTNGYFPERKAILPDPVEMYQYLLGNDFCLKREAFRQEMTLSDTGKLVKDESMFKNQPITRISGFDNDVYSNDMVDDIGIEEFFLPELFTRGASIPPIDAPVYIVGGYAIGPADLFRRQFPRLDFLIFNYSDIFPSLSDFASLKHDSTSFLNRMVFKSRLTSRCSPISKSFER